VFIQSVWNESSVKFVEITSDGGRPTAEGVMSSGVFSFVCSAWRVAGNKNPTHFRIETIGALCLHSIMRAKHALAIRIVYICAYLSNIRHFLLAVEATRLDIFSKLYETVQSDSSFSL
jgi:hypothetical protein